MNAVQPVNRGHSYGNNRLTRCIGIIGTTGSGKTSTLMDLIRIWNKDHPTGLLWGHDPHLLFEKYTTNRIESLDPRTNLPNTNWAIPLEKVRNSLIVLDDYVNLMSSKKGSQQYIPTPGMERMFMQRRTYCNDIIFVCHSANSVIPAITKYVTHYIIFKTQADEGEFDGRMYGGAKLAKAAKMVNAYCVKIGGMGRHPNDEKYDGQGFPHVILDNTTGIATPVNMKQSLFKAHEYNGEK